MTMPHLANCAHTGEGWCLECVRNLHDEKERWRHTALFYGEQLRQLHGALNVLKGVADRVLPEGSVT